MRYSEQQEIVRLVESLFALAGQLEARLARAGEHAHALAPRPRLCRQTRPPKTPTTNQLPPCWSETPEHGQPQCDGLVTAFVADWNFINTLLTMFNHIQTDCRLNESRKAVTCYRSVALNVAI